MPVDIPGDLGWRVAVWIVSLVAWLCFTLFIAWLCDNRVALYRGLWQEAEASLDRLIAHFEAVTVSDDTAQALKTACAERGISQKDAIDMAIVRWSQGTGKQND